MTLNDWTQRLLDQSQPLLARVEAAQELAGTFPDNSAWQALCSVVNSEDEDPILRCAVVRVLPDWKREAAIEQLVRAYSNRQVRAAALETLEELGSVTGEYEKILLAALTAFEGGATDAYIANALGSVTGNLKMVLSAEMAILRSGADDARDCLFASLPQRYGRDPRLLAYLRRELQSGNARHRSLAAAGLCTLGEIEPALRAAGDPSPVVRARLAEMLGFYREEPGTPVLERLLDDPDPEVARQATKALRQLGKMSSPARSEQSKPSQHTSDWGRLLGEISRLRLADPEVALDVPDEKVTAGWLGEPGATEEQIAAAERRLGVRLPPSYREFLAESNGFQQLSNSIWRLYGTAEIDWFRVRNQDWIEAYQVGPEISPEEHLQQRGDSGEFRNSYLRSCLQISEEGDSAVLLLNPEVVTDSGEWEAWFFANWVPGACIRTSFRELMEYELNGDG